MKERILLIGEDPNLLATRAMLLAEWSTEISDTKGASSVMKAQPFDVIIIGQLVSILETKRLIAEAGKLSPAPSIMLIRFPEEDVDFGVETHLTDSWDHPGWLRDCVDRLLAERVNRQVPS